MEFKQLQSFVAVVMYKNFSDAAKKLNVSQPTISTHLRMLEEELGVQLVVRSTRSFEITPRGYELYEYATHIFEMRDRMLRRWSDDDAKTILLGASTIPSSYILPDLLADFQREHPCVRFTIHQSDSWNIAQNVANSMFDIGMIGMNIKNELLSCVPFCKDHMVLITPVTDHFQKMRDSNALDIQALKTEPFILREKGSGSQKNADEFLRKIGIEEEQLQVAACVNDQESIKNLVARGIGVSIVSERAADNFVKEGRVLRFELPDCRAERNLYLVFRRDYILRGSLKEFVEYCKKYYRQEKTAG